VRTALMPYITAQFMPRAAGDRPNVVPNGCTNLALLGQFIETHNDVVFTMESSVRTARVGVYTLLGLPKQVPDLSPTQYDIRHMLKAARTLNNNEPFLGERLLHKLLDKTYFGHVLPPLPASDKGRREAIEDELASLLGKGSQALRHVSGWLDQFGDRLRKRDK
jgi:oleate hydratase